MVYESAEHVLWENTLEYG